MSKVFSYPNLSPAQLNFLSTLNVFEVPVTIQVVEALAPISASQYIKLQEFHADGVSLIQQTENGIISLSENLPESITIEISKANSSVDIDKVINLLESKQLVDQIPRQAYVKLLQKSVKKQKALHLEMSITLDALKENKLDNVLQNLQQINKLLPSITKKSTEMERFIELSIELSKHCMARVFAATLLLPILKHTIKIAEYIGNRRQCTVATLMLGRCYWIMNKLNDSISFLSKGKDMAMELGDPDILDQTASFLGLYYWIQGRFRKAMDFFEDVAREAEETNDFRIHFEPLVLLTYCFVFQGDFYRAIGKIDYFRFSSLRQKDYFSAAGYRAVLGTILWLIHKQEEALYHLEGSQADALASNNKAAYWLSLMGLSSMYLMEGDHEKGGSLFEKTLSAAGSMGHVHQLYHPFILASHFKAEEIGCKPLPGWKFDELYREIMAGPATHIQGTALRLLATRLAARGGDKKKIIRVLKESEKLLKQCEIPTELSATQFELARFYLKNKDNVRARVICYEAYQNLGGSGDIFYPDDLRFLIEDKSSVLEKDANINDVLEPFIQLLEELISASSSLDPTFLLRILSRAFRAEHSCLFVFNSNSKKPPDVLAARNLSKHFVFSEYFHENLAVAFKCLHQKKLITVQIGNSKRISKQWPALQILCIPIFYRRRVVAVLYFDNSCLENCFNFIKSNKFKRLDDHLTKFIEKYLRLEQTNNKQKETIIEQECQAVFSDDIDIIGKNPLLIQALHKAKQFAASDASVLILGETGVGKDLFARFIHRNSHRHDKPIVIVDLSTMPENLIESELFGYEKGAFTGADRQKIGRVESANGGTLFIDEIGEISLKLQVKLLRLLQEKSFVRIGGTKTISSDFRLIVATNRNLSEEVSAGNFREDLYYRLRVLEITVPPLCQRPEDIVLIAQHFISHYANKYNRSAPVLSQEHEAALRKYSWPGNVRELKNVIERAVLVAENDQIEFDFVYRPEKTMDDHIFSEMPTMDEIQRRYINYLLKKTGGQIGGPNGAAKILGMKRTTVNHRIKKLGINPSEFHS